MRAIITLLSLQLACGCSASAFESGWSSGEEEDTDTFGAGGQTLGGVCDAETSCGEGLTCSQIDERCHIACASGEICLGSQVCSGVDGTCWPEGGPGTAQRGSPCGAPFDCVWGLVCSAAGVCEASGAPGTTPVGEPCGQTSECQLYLSCLDGKCQGIIPPFWRGAECGEDALDSEPLRVLFEVPISAGEPYRLPFPNDIRRSAGRPVLTDHLVPDVEIPGAGNPAAQFVDMIENDLDGFGVNSFVYFRFNRNTGFDSLSRDAFYLMNIDQGSENYGEKASTEWRASSAGGRYICRNWLALGPTLGRPLHEGTTYAAIVTTDVTDPSGNPVTRDADFEVVMGEERPVDDAPLAKAWDAYAPLRAYLANQAIDADTIAGAAVFTTGRPQGHLPILRDAVRGEPEPQVHNLSVKALGEYSLYTGKLTVPFFQEGKLPFQLPGDGGAIAWGADGVPLVAEEEEVSFALAVPSGATPVAGWPVVLYAHGTGGSELSFVEEGLAQRMSAIGVAIIGLEQVMHGERRGLEEDEAELEAYAPQRLVYNLLNPRATRDNHLQAAADHFQLARLVERFADLSGRAEVVFDPERLLFFGHSQGASGPFLFAVHEPLVKLVVLSGAGGNTAESLLHKTSPFDVSQALKLVLLDPQVDRYHPFVNLVQAAFDEVDPVNFGRTAFREGYDDLGYPARHVFMSYGIGDTYTPEPCQLALAKALGVRQWAVPGHELEYVNAVEELPYTGSTVTAVVVQYEPDPGQDGHFVAFHSGAAAIQLDTFLRTFVENGAPTLVAP